MKSNIIDQKRRRYGIDEFVTKDDSSGVGDCEGERSCNLVSHQLS
jgi:hypothetical protein